jgi:hypothetical protein
MSRTSATVTRRSRPTARSSSPARPFHKPGAGCAACPRCRRSRRTAVSPSCPIEQTPMSRCICSSTPTTDARAIAGALRSPARAGVLARANAALPELVVNALIAGRNELSCLLGPTCIATSTPLETVGKTRCRSVRGEQSSPRRRDPPRSDLGVLGWRPPQYTSGGQGCMDWIMAAANVVRLPGHQSSPIRFAFCSRSVHARPASWRNGHRHSLPAP